ncbi:hypothetical protein H4R99_005411 [Coemansia sp. RSA 1722]|nr:hypothetical protein IWW45_000966 [Coemansia sp. RSA 485]KAJ2595286.1 hypothetical protein H4R99_005411 [Coemansia sp. RSA 1722]KAJ2595319.1 hypothetical protein GGF39_003872 [Coemansia sp. RSA 1721]
MKSLLRTAAALALPLLAMATPSSPTAPLSSISQAAATVAPPLSSFEKQGNSQYILCQLNRDRQARYQSPVFLHSTLNQVAQTLGQRYSSGTFESSLFNDLYNAQLAPLGSSVTASYKVLGTFDSDRDYVPEIEKTIYNALFARNLDAIGVYQIQGVYTIVLASGLQYKPQNIDVCPYSSTPYTPPDGSSAPGSVVNGVDLPRFLCSINRERQKTGLNAFVVHTALANEAQEQVKVMKSLGHYTVDGPRNVDDEIYAQRVNVKQLYWMAGDRYRNSDSLVNVLMSTYSNIVLDPNYQVIGVAQLDGFWSVIFGGLYRNVNPGNTCPLTIDDVTYTS